MGRKILINWVLPALGAASLWGMMYHYRLDDWLGVAIMGGCAVVFWRMWWVRKRSEFAALHAARVASRDRAAAEASAPEEQD